MRHEISIYFSDSQAEDHQINFEGGMERQLSNCEKYVKFKNMAHERISTTTKKSKNKTFNVWAYFKNTVR